MDIHKDDIAARILDHVRPLGLYASELEGVDEAAEAILELTEEEVEKEVHNANQNN